LHSGSWQQLSIGKLATVDCWAEVYVENLSGQAVWFDDLEIATGALPVAVVVQETHRRRAVYDPWGLELAGIGYNASGNPEHRWKYNGGVERTSDFGLHWDESGARMYDPQVPRFLGVDPLADREGQESWTPYHYGFNNPLRYNDPDGKCPTCDDGVSPQEVIASTAVSTVKGLAVSLFNAGAMLVDPVGAATGVLTGRGLGNLRASIAEDGSLSVGNRPAATSVGQAAGYVVSDALDLINTGTTVGTGGGAGVAKTGLVIMAKTGAKTGVVNAVVQKVKTHLHHSDPKFLGGNPNQKLTKIKTPDHKQLHKDLNKQLDTKVDPNTGRTMMPKKGNKGADIQTAFSRTDRLQALADFYKSPTGSIYKGAARDFFKQHPHLK
jgi:RHS repeat-associated protein